MRLALAFSLAAALGFASPSAHATTILAFAQTASTGDVFATNSTPSTTRIDAIDVGATISTYLEGGTPISAFFNLTAISSGQAVAVLDSQFQTFDGRFSVTSGAGGSGTNYLSGSFADLTAAQGSSATLRSSEPRQAVIFTSSLIQPNEVGSPLGLAFSFADVTPPVNSLCGPALSPTLCGFAASVTGVFSANTVPIPEPTSLALIGAWRAPPRDEGVISSPVYLT